MKYWMLESADTVKHFCNDNNYQQNQIPHSYPTHTEPYFEMANDR